MIERPRWAWEELQPGDLIQDKDEWQNDDGRWHPLILTSGACTQVRDGLRARRPHNITALLVERDEARAEVQRLQEVVNNLYSEPTARQVQQMLRTWATELDWSAGCFDSVGRDKVSAMQRVLVVMIERIETMINPEVTSADA